ncbi:MAG: hypothetical protein JNM68_05490 [Dinghuibacter sp.]|nr:hypothetical protein [Dinghuibacter sp.]
MKHGEAFRRFAIILNCVQTHLLYTAIRIFPFTCKPNAITYQLRNPPATLLAIFEA